MTYEEGAKTAVSRRSAVKVFAGAATVVAGSAVLAACGSSGSTAGTSGGTGSTAGATAAPSGVATVTAGTATAAWYAVTSTQLAITTRGNDCWGSADTCTYLDQKATGAGAWTVQVVSLSSTSTWAKAGIMARSSLDPTDQDVFLAVTVNNGVVLQFRETSGENEGSGPDGDNMSLESNGAGGVSPMWLKLQTDASGNWTGWNSSDGKTWNNSTSAAANPISLGSSYLVGLAATAHNAGSHGTATFASPGGFASKSFTADLVGTNDTAAVPTSTTPGA